MNNSGRRVGLMAATAAIAVLPFALVHPAIAESSTTETVASNVSQGPTPIERRYLADENLRALLGQPVAAEQTDGGISYRQYQRGWLYYSDFTGVHEIHGDIARKFTELGGHQVLGVPSTDERRTPDGVGRFTYFAGSDRTGTSAVYWHPDLGAHGIWGPALSFWAENGHETGYLSYPTSTTTRTPDNIGLVNHFRGADGAGASVYWTAETGAHAVRGEIRRVWGEQGWETGLGYPTSNEVATIDGVGRYTTFTGTDNPPAAIYWHPTTGAHFMRGAILDHYRNLRATTSYLGYPVSDQYIHSETGDTRVDFQGGFILIDAESGEVIDGRG